MAKNPRADLYIPSMKLIVKVKFLRAGDKMQKLSTSTCSDASPYNAMGNDCAGIAAFIWDDSARSHEHDYLRQGLKKFARRHRCHRNFATERLAPRIATSAIKKGPKKKPAKKNH